MPAGAFPVGSIAGLISITGASEAQRDILGVQRSMTLTGESAGRAAAGLDTTAGALGTVGRASSAASTSSAKLRAAQLSLVAASERYTAVLADEDASLGRLATAEASVIRANERVKASTPTAAMAESTAATEANAVGMSRASKAVSGFARTAAGLGLMIGGFELLKKGLDIAKEASRFQSDMLLIQTQAGGSSKDISSLTDAVLNMAESVGTAPDQLATSLYHVYSVGFKTGQALDVVRIAAEGAKVGNADLEQTTNALTATVASGIGGIKGMSDSVSGMSKAMGVLNAIVGAGDMRLQDLNDALGTGVLAAARGFGVTIQEVGAALAVFGDNNIRGADAATKLRMSIQDIAKPGVHANDYLVQIGLTADDLRKKLEEHGLSGALNMLSQHMISAGITGNKVASFIEDVFTKKAGVGLAVLIEQIGRFNLKLDQVSKGGDTFASRWTATTKTASFAWAQVNAQLDATGIRVANTVLPALTSAGKWLGDELPRAAAALGGVLSGPLAAGWAVITTGASLLGDVLGPAINLLNDIKGPLGDVAELVGGMWLAFKAGQIVGTIITTAVTWISELPARTAAMALSVRGSVTSYVQSMASIGTSSEGAAVTAGTAMAGIADEAAVMSGAVVAEGETAAVGWTGLLGPLAAVGIGIGLLVTMFHSSSSASKEAADAAKAYTDALKTTGSQGQDTIVGAIVKQLQDNKVPQSIDYLNSKLKTLGIVGGYSAQQFVTAIQTGGPVLDQLRSKLTAAIDAAGQAALHTGNIRKAVDSGVRDSALNASQAAQKLLTDLNAQRSGLTKAASEELKTAKTYGVVATSIDQVSQKMQVGVDVSKTYAGMLGLVVDNNGIVGESAHLLEGQIADLNEFVDTGSQTVSGFVSAWQTFAKSAGTAADRAAIIGATLKDANGDALNYATAINGAAVADAGLVSSLAQAAKGVGKHGESIHALLSSIVNLKTGTIDYNNTAAAPLIQSLNSIQSAAMTAAQAEFQHARMTMNGKDAADAAYNLYVSKTQGALIDQAKQLGLSKDQASALAKQYFGMPKDVKTLIEQEGANPVIDVLNAIGKQLSYLTGHPWTSHLDADPTAAQRKAKDLQDQINAIRQNRVPGVTVDSSEGRAMVIGLQNQLNGLSARTYSAHVGVIDHASYSLGRIIEQMQYIGGHPVTQSVTIVTKTGHVVAQATGGTVIGPGSETSDSVPRMLSNHEFVVRASQAKKYASLLTAINSGGPLPMANRSSGDYYSKQPAGPVNPAMPAPLDLRPLTSRLDAIERRLAAAANGPERFAAAAVDGYRAAGKEQARQLTRAGRKF